MFNKIFAGLVARGGKPNQLMIDPTYLKACASSVVTDVGIYPLRDNRPAIGAWTPTK